MISLVAESLMCLLQTEAYLITHKGQPLHGSLKSITVASGRPNHYSAEQICHGMDLACVLYFKVVLCLQRSVALAMLLRRYGFEGEVVIGARITPFRSHAWVELNNVVLNDKPYVPQLYRELERY